MCDDLFYFGGWAPLSTMGSLFISKMADYKNTKLEFIWSGKLEVLRENSARMQHCLPQIPTWRGLHKQKKATTQPKHDAVQCRRWTCCSVHVYCT
jgi:hypothetical protein